MALETDVHVDNLWPISFEGLLVHALCRYMYARTLLFRTRTYLRQKFGLNELATFAASLVKWALRIC